MVWLAVAAAIVLASPPPSGLGRTSSSSSPSRCCPPRTCPRTHAAHRCAPPTARCFTDGSCLPPSAPAPAVSTSAATARKCRGTLGEERWPRDVDRGLAQLPRVWRERRQADAPALQSDGWRCSISSRRVATSIAHASPCSVAASEPPWRPTSRRTAGCPCRSSCRRTTRCLGGPGPLSVPAGVAHAAPQVRARRGRTRMLHAAAGGGRTS
jgi:hypothetical protein